MSDQHSVAPEQSEAQPPNQATLPPAAARRVANQVARGYRGTFGADTGLRTIVSAVARQMFSAGSSSENVRRAFADCVLDHPARLVSDPVDRITGQSQSAMLVEVTRECVASVALEYGRQ